MTHVLMMHFNFENIIGLISVTLSKYDTDVRRYDKSSTAVKDGCACERDALGANFGGNFGGTGCGKLIC